MKEDAKKMTFNAKSDETNLQSVIIPDSDAYPTYNVSPAMEFLNYFIS